MTALDRLRRRPCAYVGIPVTAANPANDLRRRGRPVRGVRAVAARGFRHRRCAPAVPRDNRSTAHDALARSRAGRNRRHRRRWKPSGSLWPDRRRANVRQWAAAVPGEPTRHRGCGPDRRDRRQRPRHRRDRAERQAPCRRCCRRRVAGRLRSERDRAGDPMGGRSRRAGDQLVACRPRAGRRIRAGGRLRARARSTRRRGGGQLLRWPLYTLHTSRVDAGARVAPACAHGRRDKVPTAPRLCSRSRAHVGSIWPHRASSSRRSGRRGTTPTSTRRIVRSRARLRATRREARTAKRGDRLERPSRRRWSRPPQRSSSEPTPSCAPSRSPRCSSRPHVACSIRVTRSARDCWTSTRR